MKKLIAFASATVLGLGLAACDSPAEESAEEQAEVIEEEADMIEDSAEGDTNAMTEEVEEPTM